jgi:hypothetical protein
MVPSVVWAISFLRQARLSGVGPMRATLGTPLLDKVGNSLEECSKAGMVSALVDRNQCRVVIAGLTSLSTPRVHRYRGESPTESAALPTSPR